jgi:hypothetical protein
VVLAHFVQPLDEEIIDHDRQSLFLTSPGSGRFRGDIEHKKSGPDGPFAKLMIP